MILRLSLKRILIVAVFTAMLLLPTHLSARSARSFLSVAYQSSIAGKLPPTRSPLEILTALEITMWGREWPRTHIQLSPFRLSAKKEHLLNRISSSSSDEHSNHQMLTKLWNLEAIGTPEARQLVSDLQQAGFTFQSSELVVFDRYSDDSSFHDLLSSGKIQTSLRLADGYRYQPREDDIDSDDESHGMVVAHLLAGTNPLPGASAVGKISALVDVDNSVFVDVNNAELYSKYLDYLGMPSVINASVEILVGDILSHIGEKTLIVYSSGNEFSSSFWKRQRDLSSSNYLRSYQEKVGESMPRMIMVGSTDPDGFISTFSIPNDCVVVTSPSGMCVVSYNGHKAEWFGGTSGAAPLVSGVLADVKSILPELTREAAITLLQSTAIKTAMNEVSELNGAGVVNHYKILRVALRLASDGYDGERMPDELYDYMDFSNEVADLLRSPANEDDFFKLRKALFLAPENEEVRIQLAERYRELQLYQQALFYDSPSRTSRNKMIQEKFTDRMIGGLDGSDGATTPVHEKNLIRELMQHRVAEAKGISLAAADKEVLRVLEDDSYIIDIPGYQSLGDVFENALQEKDMVAKKILSIIADENHMQPYTDQEINDKLEELGIIANVSSYLRMLGGTSGKMGKEKRRVEATENAIVGILSRESPDAPYTDKKIRESLEIQGIQLSSSTVGRYTKAFGWYKDNWDKDRRKVYTTVGGLVDDLANFFHTSTAGTDTGLKFAAKLADAYFKELSGYHQYWKDYFLRSVAQRLLSREVSLPINGFPHEKLPDYFPRLQEMKLDEAAIALRALAERYWALRSLISDSGSIGGISASKSAFFLGLVFYGELHTSGNQFTQKIMLEKVLRYAYNHIHNLRQSEELQKIVAKVLQQGLQEVETVQMLVQQHGLDLAKNPKLRDLATSAYFFTVSTVPGEPKSIWIDVDFFLSNAVWGLAKGRMLERPSNYQQNIALKDIAHKLYEQLAKYEKKYE